jgi:hypothetical protein
MNNSARLTQLLAVVFVGLVGMAIALNIARRSATQPAPTRNFTEISEMLFPAVEPRAITRIRLQNTATGKVLVFTKQPGQWRVEDEMGKIVSIDLAQVPDLLHILANLRYNRLIDPTQSTSSPTASTQVGANLEAFGLANGGLYIAQFEAGGSHTIRIGALTPDTKAAYVQRDNEQAILLVPAAATTIFASLLAEKGGS